MGEIISLFPESGHSTDGVIDLERVEYSRVHRKLDPGMIQPAVKDTDDQAIEEHAAEPIKSVEEIQRISSFLIANKRYRDNMLFIVGINFGLRVSDLLRLRFDMVLDKDLNFRTDFPILEKKTSNTRKVKKNRYITINDAAVDAITMYLRYMSESGKVVHLNDYMFRSEGNRGKNSGLPMTRKSVDRILKDIAHDVGIQSKVSTHTLRKTFGYHQMVMSGNDPRKLLLLQKIFGHSTASQTLDYIGITSEEIQDAYLTLNLGGREYYKGMSNIGEQSA